ncbi:hypothetical protein MMC25_000026 [Agyrium rufum]|nr:hypothetical protein [Agyrium rufum]
MIGIGVQEAFILCFIFLAVGFQRRMNAMENPRPTNWRPLLYCLYGALAMITIRIIYRLCEFSGGLYSYAPTHEWLQFTWDALPMLLALAIFNVWHPGTILLGLESDFPRQTRAQKKAAKIEKKELRRQKKADRKAEKEASKEEKEVAKKGGRIGDVLRMDRFSGGKGLAKRGTFEILGDDARGKEVSPGIVSSPEPSPGISPSPLPYLPSYAAHEDRGAVGAAAAAVGVSRSAADVEAPSSGFGLAKRTTFGREEDRGPYVGARQGLEWERVRGAARGR